MLLSNLMRLSEIFYYLGGRCAFLGRCADFPKGFRQMGAPVTHGQKHLFMETKLALFLGCALLALGMNDDTAGQHLAVVDSGRALALAFTNPKVTFMTLTTSIRLEESDWEGLGPLPYNITRNFTLSGTPEALQSGDYPAIDFNYVKERVSATA